MWSNEPPSDHCTWRTTSSGLARWLRLRAASTRRVRALPRHILREGDRHAADLSAVVDRPAKQGPDIARSRVVDDIEGSIQTPPPRSSRRHRLTEPPRAAHQPSPLPGPDTPGLHVQLSGRGHQRFLARVSPSLSGIVLILTHVSSRSLSCTARRSERICTEIEGPGSPQRSPGPTLTRSGARHPPTGNAVRPARVEDPLVDADAW